MRTWNYNRNTPGSPGDTKQSVWDRTGIMADRTVVMSAFTNNFNRARHLAASAPHSGDWLHALPLSTCELRLDNELELLWIFVSAPASANRTSALVANRLTGGRPIHTTSRTQRHHISSADQSKHAIRSGTARTVAHRRKTTGRTDPHSWQRAKSVTWDVTVTDTVADSCLHLTSAKAGGAAENAARYQGGQVR